MRRAVLTLAVALVAAVPAGASSQVWHETRAPEGGVVGAIAVAGDGTLYAATPTGLFVARPGAPWRPSALPGLDETAQILAVEAPAPMTAYVSAFDGDYNSLVFATTDAGQTWSRADQGLDEEDTAWGFAVAPGAVYALGDARVYRRDAGEQAWHPLAPVLDGDDDSPVVEGEDYGDYTTTLAVDPKAPATLYVGGYRGIYTSVDGGAHWRKTGVGFPSAALVTALAVRPTVPRTIYAGTAAHGVFESLDGGLTWRPARAGLPATGAAFAEVTALAADPERSGVLYAATVRGPATSVDGGASWRVAGGSDAPALSSLALDPRASGRLVAGSFDRGVLTSADRGETWQLANGGLEALWPLALAVDAHAGGAVYLGTVGTGLVVSRDGGSTWTPTLGAPARTIVDVAVDPKRSGSAYLATTNAGVLKTLDAGATWAVAGPLTTAERPAPRRLCPDVRALAIVPQNPRALYAVSQCHYGAGVYRSADGGATWRRVFSSFIPGDAAIAAVAVDPKRPGTVYAGTGWPSREGPQSWGVFVSRDTGKHWRRVVAGLLAGKQRPAINELAVSPKTRDVYATTDLGVFRLRRGAGRWTPLLAGLPRLADGKTVAWARPIAIDPRSGAVRVGTQRGLYELARVGGAPRWRAIAPPLVGRSILALAGGGGSRLFAARPGHVFVSG